MEQNESAYREYFARIEKLKGQIQSLEQNECEALKDVQLSTQQQAFLVSIEADISRDIKYICNKMMIHRKKKNMEIVGILQKKNSKIAALTNASC